MNAPAFGQNFGEGIKKLTLKWWFWVLFCTFFFSYPIYRSVNRVLPPELPVLFHVPEFSLTDENNKTFGSNDLKGKIYVVNFHFTSCPTICVELMHRMKIIQRRVKGVGQSIALVSLTVDPETDVPAVLFKKARELDANPFVWKFLTGSPEVVKTLIVEGFKSAVGEKTPESAYDIAHSGKFFVIDREGNARAMYSNTDQEIDQMMIDIGLLINRNQKG